MREEVIRDRDVAETLTDGPGRGIVTGSCGGFGSYSGVVSNGIVDILLEVQVFWAKACGHTNPCPISFGKLIFRSQRASSLCIDSRADSWLEGAS